MPPAGVKLDQAVAVGVCSSTFARLEGQEGQGLT